MDDPMSSAIASINSFECMYVAASDSSEVVVDDNISDIDLQQPRVQQLQQPEMPLSRTRGYNTSSSGTNLVEMSRSGHSNYDEEPIVNKSFRNAVTASGEELYYPDDEDKVYKLDEEEEKMFLLSLEEENGEQNDHGIEKYAEDSDDDVVDEKVPSIDTKSNCHPTTNAVKGEYNDDYYYARSVDIRNQSSASNAVYPATDTSIVPNTSLLDDDVYDDEYCYDVNVKDSTMTTTPGSMMNNQHQRSGSGAMNISVHCINSNADYQNISNTRAMINPTSSAISNDVVNKSHGNVRDEAVGAGNNIQNTQNAGDDYIVGPPKIQSSVATSQNSRIIPTATSSNSKNNSSSSIASNDVMNESSFVYDDDDEYDDNELSWRLNPFLSLSDWNIEVVVVDNNDKGSQDNVEKMPATTTYPVHKSVLAVGPRRSNYFANEFKRHAAEKKAAAAAEKARTLLLLQQMEQQQLDEQKKEAALLLERESARRSGTDLFELSDDNPFARLAAAGCNFIGVQTETPKQLYSRNASSSQTDNRAAPAQQQQRKQAPVVPPKPNDIPSVSKLELQTLAAVAFPYLLDFMYSTSGKLDIKTERATALHYLSKKLDIKSLQYKVEQFWKGDLTIDTVITYYQHGRLFNDSSIIAAAELLCAHHLLELPDNVVVELLETVDATFMYNVVTIVAQEERARYNTYGYGATIAGGTDPSKSAVKCNEELKKFYMQLSLLIAVYCNVHRRILSPEMFWKLTSERHLPLLEAKAAKALLDTQDSIVGPNYDLISLTSRCVDVLADHWEDTLTNNFGGKFNLNRPNAYEEKDDSEYPTNGHGDDPSSTMTNKERGSTYIDLPKLTGDAMEEFVSLALKNAKVRINQIETENSLLQSRNESLQAELDLLKMQASETKQLLSAKPNMRSPTSRAASVDVIPASDEQRSRDSMNTSYPEASSVVAEVTMSPSSLPSTLPKRGTYSPIRRSKIGYTN